MKRREFNIGLAAATAVSLSPFSVARKARAATVVGGATPVFNYTSFAGSPSAISLVNYANFNGSSIQMYAGTSHHGGGAYYTTKQPNNSFTTQFSFNFSSGATGAGLSFVLEQNFGVGDANMCGFGGLMNQGAQPDNIGIKFDVSDAAGGGYPSGGAPSSTGLYLNQGTSPLPPGSLGQCPFIDLNPYGLILNNGHTFLVTIVYDGSLLTMVVLDTTTNAQGRYAWPLNLINSTNGYQSTVGLVSNGYTDGVYSYLNSWSYWTGYNPRLATPTFSPSPGNFSGSQKVTISYPPGSTCYYTTNGLLPTSSSTQYTGPITVNANTVLQAVAIETNYTDSLVASGNYVIGNLSNTINFSGGFSSGNLVPAGFAYLNGSAYRVTDSTQGTSGAVWFPVPVTVSSFSTAFTVSIASGAQGFAFVIQNPPPASQALTGVQIIGTNGQISFNALATPLVVGQYVTISGTFGGTGSISGYSNPTSYIVGATNGITTATLCGSKIAATTTNGSASFSTASQSLVAGAGVYFDAAPGGFGADQIFYVVSSGLTSTTCQIAATPGGTPITATSSASFNILFGVGLGGGGLTITTMTGTPTGLTFSVNNNTVPAGPMALGLGAQSLGCAGYNSNNSTAGQAFGFLNSVVVAIAGYGYGGDPGGNVGLYTNGATPYGSGISTGLNFNTTFNVTLTYSSISQQLAMTMQAASGGTTFSHTFTGVNIPSIVGGNTAYVGFTGGSGGGAHAVQAIQSWTYAAASSVQAAAVPAAPTNLQVR